MHTRLPGRATRQFFLNTRSSSTVSLLFAFQPKKTPTEHERKKKRRNVKLNVVYSKWHCVLCTVFLFYFGEWDSVEKER